MPCATGSSDDDHPLPEEAAEETVLTEAEVQDLTERFLFGDPAGVKATGPTGAATRATLRLIVTCVAVRKVLWSSRRPEIKALLADEQGRFDQEELLAHMFINNALGRPLLPPAVSARATSERPQATRSRRRRRRRRRRSPKARTSAAISDARAAACKDASRLSGIAAAEAALGPGACFIWEPKVFQMKFQQLFYSKP